MAFFLGTARASATANPTTTTLSITSGTSAVTSVASGSTVTLTAAVVSGSAKVTIGQVNFCDASVTYCTDIHRLGTAQLTSAGIAVLRVLPSLGSHSYKAVFAGTNTNAASASTPSALTVTGLIPSAIAFTVNTNTPGNSTLTATVGGSGITAPTGAVSFLNASNKNSVLGTATLGTGTAGITFLNSDVQYHSAPYNYISAAALGDFNNDGFLDVAGITPCCQLLGGNPFYTTAMLGDGHGNFTAAASTTIGVGRNTAPVGAGDFNGDGNLDLAVVADPDPSASGYDTLTILLGKGDGTFTVGQSIATGTDVSSFVVADFNRDGIPDLAVLNGSSDLVLLLLGNGDGTFTASTATPAPAGSDPCAMATGDFNGDSMPDLAVSANCDSDNPGTLTILLGNGDGTFTAATASPTVGADARSIATGDFNGDGKLDLAANNAINGTVTILLGNGDGTFTAASESPITVSTIEGQFPTSISAGDFNGDGKLDLLLAPGLVLLGNGNGTFSSGSAIAYGSPLASPLAEGDFNGDGLTDIATSDTAFLTATQTSTATATGIAVSPGTGFQLVTASYAGDSRFMDAASGATSVAAAQATPTVVLNPSANPAVLGASITFTATVTGPGLEPTGKVTFFDGSTLLGTGALTSSGVATYATSALAPGSDIITASYNGDANYNAANATPLTLIVTGASTATLAVAPSATTIVATQPLTVAVTVTSTASAAPTGSVTLTGGTFITQEPLASGTANFTIAAGALAAGVNTLTATYSGDGVYASQTTTATVTVSPVAIAVPAPASVAAGSKATATATITAGSTYSGTLNLGCSLTTLPTGAQSLPTCNLSPTSVALQASASGTSTLTVTTTAASAVASLRQPSHEAPWEPGGGGVVLAALILCGIPGRRRRWMPLLAVASLFVAIGVTGCSGSNAPPTNTLTPATTSGTYTFTVTGVDSATASVTTSTKVVVVVE